jgi:hypothetical protein
MNKISLSLALVSLVAGNVAIAAQSDSEYRSDDGLLIIRSAGTGYTPSGPPPAFDQLDSNHDNRIDANEALGYKLLANDFRMADSNHDGNVSKREYERWVNMP